MRPRKDVFWQLLVRLPGDPELQDTQITFRTWGYATRIGAAMVASGRAKGFDVREVEMVRCPACQAYPILVVNRSKVDSADDRLKCQTCGCQWRRGDRDGHAANKKASG